jgi:hypothetical protein
MAVSGSPRRGLRSTVVVSTIAALVGGALLVAVPAAAVPDAPTITSPAGSADTVGPDYTVSGDLAVPAGYDYVRVQWRQGATVVDECFQSLGPGDTTFSCTIAVPPPGVYTVVAQHSDSAEPGPNDWSADSNAVTIRVGGIAPALLSYPESGTVWPTTLPQLSGTGPALGSVVVEIIAGEGGGTYCVVDPIPASGQWTCTSSITPNWSWGEAEFRAYGYDITAASTGDDTIYGELIPPPPTSKIVLGPASISFTAEGSAGTFFVMRVFEAILNGEGSSFTFRETCASSGTPPTISCTLTGLTPGVWNLYTEQDANETYFSGIDEFVRIPSAPTNFRATVLDDRSVRFAGNGVAGFRAIVRDAAQNTVCSVIVSSNGSWQCTVKPPVGTASYRSLQQSVGFDTNDFAVSSDLSLDGFSALTSALSVTVPPPPPPPVPTPELTPLPWVLQGYDGAPLTPGQQLTLTASGLPTGTEVVVEIRSTPRVLGSAVVTDTGTFSLNVVVPTDLEPGDHTLVAIATPPGGVASPVSLPVVVVAAPVVDPVKETVDSVAPPKVEPEGGSAAELADRSNLAAPSAITESIPTLQRIFDEPWALAASGGLALALLLLVAFPAELLNSTLSSNTGRLGRWFVAIERRAEQVTEWFTRVSRTRALAAALLVGVTSLIFGFVDPDYGFDPVSVRMTVSLAIGLFLITYVAAWISGAIARRAWVVETQVTLQPVALLFAVVGVVIARLLEFSPGFLIGLVIGLDLLSRVDAAVRARVVVLSTSVTVAIAVGAWFAFSALTALSSGTPGWAELLVSDALVATTAEGLTAAIASLLPLGFLAGHEVFRHSKPQWAVTFTVVAALFALIVLPTAAGETAPVEDMAFWLLVMGIFAVVTLSLWAVLQFTGRRDADGEGSDPTAEATLTTTVR